MAGRPLFSGVVQDAGAAPEEEFRRPAGSPAPDTHAAAAFSPSAPASQAPIHHAPAHHTPAGASRAAVALLEDFGRLVGLPALYFGDDGCCWLDLGGEHIACIATLGDGGFLRLHGEVAELPPERDAPDLSGHFSRLLAQNAVAARRGDALPFAIDPRRNALVLTATVPLSATGQQLHDAMETLVDQLIALKRNPPPLDGGPESDEPENDDEASDGSAHEAADGAGPNGAPRQAARQQHRRNGVTRATHLAAPPPAMTGELVWRI